jgi:Enolase C-terminal domain-like
VWLEIDCYDPAALATIRSNARTRIASCESLYGRRQFRLYLEQQAVDVAIIDVAWNGILRPVYRRGPTQPTSMWQRRSWTVSAKKDNWSTERA